MAINRNLIAICFVLVGAGIVGAAWASSVSGAAASRYFTDCFPFGSSPDCGQHLSTMSTFGALSTMFQAVAAVGVIVVILLVVLDYVQTHPASPPAPAYPPAAVCPRCGRPIRWIPPYGRWYCDAEAVYV